VKNPERGEEYTESKFCFYESGMFEKMNYYYFIDEWEMVPGKWVFRISTKDRILVEKEFTCVKEEN
jgi:hypothetical protein